MGDRRSVDFLVQLLEEQAVGLKDDLLESGSFRLLQNLEKVLPEEWLASGKTQGANAEVSDLVHEINGTPGVECIVPSGLPIVAADAFGLAIFG